jgi:2-methylfumaryl-CoA isomerase
MVVALTDRQWRAVVDSCGIGPDVAAIEERSGLDFRKEGDRFEARETLNRLVEDWVAKRAYAEVARVFGKNGVLFERYQSFAELVRNDPRCGLGNPLFGTVDQPGIGKMLTPAALLEFSAQARLAPVRAPALGEHTDEILSNVLGLSSGEIAGLHDRKIVASPA